MVKRVQGATPGGSGDPGGPYRVYETTVFSERLHIGVAACGPDPMCKEHYQGGAGGGHFFAPPESLEERLANAQLIGRALNAHEELLACLRPRTGSALTGWTRPFTCSATAGTSRVSSIVVELQYPKTVLSCDECEWFGDDPKWVSTTDHFQPPKGEVPACPLCGSLKVTLYVID